MCPGFPKCSGGLWAEGLRAERGFRSEAYRAALLAPRDWVQSRLSILISLRPTETRGPGMGSPLGSWDARKPALLSSSRVPLGTSLPWLSGRLVMRRGPGRLFLSSVAPGQPVKLCTSPCFSQQVSKVHEPPREDAAPPAPPPPQPLQPESDTPQQPSSSPRGKSRSPAPPADKEGEWGAP